MFPQPSSEATEVVSRKIVLEVCVETMQACLAAREGGADRIELCSALREGGLTPSHGLIRQAVQQSGLPVHVLLRPRTGDFFYSDADFLVMLDDLAYIKTTGARGVVFGVLLADNTIDIPRTRQLTEQAGSLEATFHRAFDETPVLTEALEDVIGCGCRRVLSSGGTGNALGGIDMLQRLVQQADGRIEVAVCGNLRAANAAQLARTTGAVHFHSALRRQGAHSNQTPWRESTSDLSPADVHLLMEQLRGTR